MVSSRAQLNHQSRVYRTLDRFGLSDTEHARGPVRLSWRSIGKSYQVRNVVPNPSPVLDTAGWSANGATLTRYHDGGAAMSTAAWWFELTPDGVTPDGYARYGGPGNLLDLVPGRPFTLALSGWHPVSQGNPSPAWFALVAHTPAGPVEYRATFPLNGTATATGRQVNVTLPEDTTGVEIRAGSGVAAAAGVLRFNLVTLYETHLNEYDPTTHAWALVAGDRPEDYEGSFWWEGTPYASPSWRRSRRGGRVYEARMPDLLDSLRVRRGRDNTDGSAGPGTLTFTMPVRNAADADALVVGDRVDLTHEWLALSWLWQRSDYTQHPEWLDSTTTGNRYLATVTGLELEYRPQADGPPAPVLRVTCSGRKAQLGQVYLTGSSPTYPLPYEAAETIADREAKIRSIAHKQAYQNLTTLDPLTTPDGARYVGPLAAGSTALAVLEDYATAIGANLTESLRTTRIIWDTLDGRANVAPAVQLTPDEIAATATWTQDMTDLVNAVTVEYGLEDARGSVEVRDQASVYSYGEFGASLSTPLRDQADAARLAGMIAGRRSRPRWRLSRLDLDLLDLALPIDKARKLWHAEAGTLVELAGMPGTTPAGRYYFVEGTETTLTKHEWRLSVYLSAAEQTGAPIEWSDVPAAMTWSDVPGDRSWLTAAAWFIQLPPAAFRWTDVPADLTYYALGPGVTIDGSTAVPTWETFPDDPA